MEHGRLALPIVIAACLCTACATKPLPRNDGEFRVRINTGSFADRQQAWYSLEERDSSLLVFGFATVSEDPGARQCAIHVPPVTGGKPSLYDKITWGEELLHCYYGNWH